MRVHDPTGRTVFGHIGHSRDNATRYRLNSSDQLGRRGPIGSIDFAGAA